MKHTVLIYRSGPRVCGQKQCDVIVCREGRCTRCLVKASPSSGLPERDIVIFDGRELPLIGGKSWI